MSQQSDHAKRLCVGLMVSHLDDAYDSALCKGAIEGAKQLDVNLIILPGRYINGVYADQARTAYEYQYNTLFSIPSYCKLDVLLVLIGTLANHLGLEERKALLSQYAGTPVITISSQIDGYPCIQVDNRFGLDELIQHLITVHHCTRIGFISGPVTNDEANLRLAVYRSVLERNGIAYDPALVTYGNFSRYCGAKVEALLDAVPDLQAIACANDQMALAVYEVLEKRGLRPGKDILVTGFDDDPIAQELHPKLTTVKSDIVSLGKEAVVEAVQYVQTGSLSRSLIPTEMILRNSCGCQENNRLRQLSSTHNPGDAGINAEIICHFLLSKCSDAAMLNALGSDLTALIQGLYDLIPQGGLRNPKLREPILNQMDVILQSDYFTLIEEDDLYTSLEYSYEAALSLVCAPEDRQALSALFIQFYRRAAEQSIKCMKAQLSSDYFMNWLTNSITRDMLVFDAYDDRGYLSVIDKLPRLHIPSSYLYAYDSVVNHPRGTAWLLPETLSLKSYHNQADPVLLSPEQQAISRSKLLDNPYLPQDRRYTMLVMPLFSAEEHYGLLMCETEHQYFRYVQTVSFQLCAALKTIALMRQQDITQKQLRQSLIQVHESNQLLSELSKTDQLTGCLNRRGFYEEMRKALQALSPTTSGHMIFADLDSLKIINDRFGHSEGDFAIQSAATILRNSIGDSGILARMGGDEFVGCSFSFGQQSVAEIQCRLEEETQRFNQQHTQHKAYRVHLSIGVLPFQCSETVVISDLLSHADALLYIQKKNKKSILRDPEQP